MFKLVSKPNNLLELVCKFAFDLPGGLNKVKIILFFMVNRKKVIHLPCWELVLTLEFQPLVTDVT